MHMEALGVEYEAGSVIANSLTFVVVHDDVAVVNIDLRSKYPEYSIGMDTDDTPELMLFAGLRTLFPDPRHHNVPTRFRFTTRKGWAIMADAGRYTVRVVLFNPSFDGPSFDVRAM